MKNTILAVGIACATMMAVAQSNARQDNSVQATGVVSPRDVATGQASGKRMHKPMTVNESTEGLQKQNIVHRDLSARETGSGMATGRASVQTARETGTGMATGKTMAADDWNTQQKNSMTGAQSNPMYKDSGSSGVNPMYEGNARNATKARSNVQNNRVATGDLDGDGTTDRTIVKSKSNITNNRVAAGDVNGDGTADVAASPNSAPAQMKGDFSRGHQPDRKAPGAANSNSSREAQSGLATGKRQHN